MSKDKERVAQINRGEMRRTLGVGDLFAIGYGDLGASIYYALGITVLYSLGAAPLSLLIAGIVFACTASTYAEMSSVVTDSGGSASYSRKTFNDLISFIAGWALLLDYIVTIAISAYSIAPYLAVFFGMLKLIPFKLIFCVFAVLVLVLVNILGAKHSTRLSLILTLFTLGTQAVIIFLGATENLDLLSFWNHLKIGGTDKIWSPSWPDFWRGTAMAMVAYTGIESMAQLSSEAKKPQHTVPKAIMIAMGTLLVVYLGLSLVALSAMTPQMLSGKYLEDPLAGIVAELPHGAALLGPWIGILAAILLFVAANAGLVGASRLAFNMGEHLQLPRFFYRLTHKSKTPYIALLIFGALAALIIVVSRGNLLFMANLYNFGAMLAFFCAHLSLIMHRVLYPDLKRPFKVRFNLTIAKRQIPVTAILGALATASVWLLVVITKPDGRYLGMAWIVFGLIMYFWFRRSYGLKASGSLQINKVALNESHFKEFQPKKILVLLPESVQLERDHSAMELACDLSKKHHAHLTFLVVEKVPFMMSFMVHDPLREEFGSFILQKAQALALEWGVNSDLLVIRSRSSITALMELQKKEPFDLLIVPISEEGPSKTVLHALGEIMRQTRGMVVVVKSSNK